MQAFLRAKREESEPNVKKTTAAVPVNLKSSSTRFRLSTWSRKGSKIKEAHVAAEESDTGTLEIEETNFQVWYYMVSINPLLAHFPAANPHFLASVWDASNIYHAGDALASISL
jgi:hypothetical protein